MNESKMILTSVLQTAQMGIVGIDAVKEKAVSRGMQKLLQSQRNQYAAIEQAAQDLAREKNWKMPGRRVVLEKVSSVGAKCRLMGKEKDTSIAGMLIQGNTRGMILGIKNQRDASRIDPKVKALSDRLLNEENINIQRSQAFL